MTLRSFSYWFLCTVAAAIAAGAAEPDMSASLSLMDSSSVAPVPEPGRAALLFAGLMAMAFTYRKAWLNMKRGS